MISLKVDVGAGNISDALEECCQLGQKLQIPIRFDANDSKWAVYPAWNSATQVTQSGDMLNWRRRGNRDWVKREDASGNP